MADLRKTMPVPSKVERAATAPVARRFLASVPMLACTSGYEQFGINEVSGYGGTQAAIGRRGFAHTVSAYGRARLMFDVNEDFCRLECSVAIRDVSPEGSKADFIVFADGREVAAVRNVIAPDPPRPLTAELGRARILELRVQPIQVAPCHPVWLDPVLLPNPILAGRPIVESNGRTLPGEYRLPESRMTELEALALGLNTDKVTIHSYLPYYSSVFDTYRKRLQDGEYLAMLEIGVYAGGSIHLWRDYFGPRLNLRCMDLNIPVSLPRGTSLHLGSACDESFVKSCFSGVSFDIIIEDGSHQVEEQIRTFLLLKPMLRPDGLYIIEDLQSITYVSRIESETSTKFEVVDLRENKGRYDDVLLVYAGTPGHGRAPKRDVQKPETGTGQDSSGQ